MDKYNKDNGKFLYSKESLIKGMVHYLNKIYTEYSDHLDEGDNYKLDIKKKKNYITN
jgi:hypothetical protein